MHHAKLRAPHRVLEELLGSPLDHEVSDKSSTAFVGLFEGEEFVVTDFHKPEWGNAPECRTDPAYVWDVFDDERDVAPFCAWLSGEVMKRVPAAQAEAYRWPLPGEPRPTPPAPARPAPRAVPPKVRARVPKAAPVPIDAHRRRVLALQAALDATEPEALAELRADLARLGPDAQALAESMARQPERTEAELRESLGRAFDPACRALDALLRDLRTGTE